jgi:hypothetical protein
MLQQMTWVVPLIAFVVGWGTFVHRAPKELGRTAVLGGGFLVGAVIAAVLGGAYRLLSSGLLLGP